MFCGHKSEELKAATDLFFFSPGICWVIKARVKSIQMEQGRDKSAPVPWQNPHVDPPAQLGASCRMGSSECSNSIPNVFQL